MSEHRYTRAQAEADGWSLDRINSGYWYLTAPHSDREIPYAEPQLSEDEVWDVILRVGYAAWKKGQGHE